MTTNPAMSQVPHRRLRLVMDLEADDVAVLVDELYNIAEKIRDNGSEVQSSTSGGNQHGYHFDLTVTDEAMTPERYREELSAWVEARRASR